MDPNLLITELRRNSAEACSDIVLACDELQATAIAEGIDISIAMELLTSAVKRLEGAQ